MNYRIVAVTALCAVGLVSCRTNSQPRVIKDIVYANIGSRQLHMNLTLPAGQPSKPRPAIIWVHGGGWQAGDYRDDPGPSYGLNDLGYITGTAEYRFTDEACYPAQIEDCKAAIRYLRANAGKYGIDPKRIGVWGGSAGGHLVALLGTTGGIRQLEGDEGNNQSSSRVQAVCDLFGPTDLTEVTMKEYIPVVTGMVEGLLGGPVKDHRGLARLASPVNFASKDDPPFLILHGDQDTLVPMSQSEKLRDALKRVGADVKLVKVKNGGHGFGPKSEPSPDEIKKIVQQFFREKLGPAESL